jgi:site-specific recombinase XerD
MSARTVQYVLAVIRQVFNTAYRHGIYIGLNPVKQVSKQKADNRRARFITSEEIWVHHQQACPKRKGQ